MSEKVKLCLYKKHTISSTKNYFSRLHNKILIKKSVYLPIQGMSSEKYKLKTFAIASKI